MIKNVIFSILFFDLLLAISLSMAGISHVDLGTSFISFIENVNRSLDSWKVQIPSIPLIKGLGEYSGGFWNVVDVLISFFNGIITIINILIRIINVIIQLIQFVLTLLYGVIAFRDDLVGIFNPNP